MYDLHNCLKYKNAMPPIAAVTNNTAFVSSIIDTDNALGVEFVGITGTLADGDATFTVLVEDGNDATLTDNAAVADANLLGTEAGAAIDYANDVSTLKIGYKGKKRYLRVTITPANNTGNIFLAAIWVLCMRTMPQSDQIVA